MAPAADGIFNNDDKKFPSLLPSASDEAPEVARWIDSAYGIMHLDSMGLSKNVFFYACKGYRYLLSQNRLSNTDLLTICDYTQSSKSKRLYVIDMKQYSVLFNTYVSHGKNSGGEYATSFSNRAETHKSSLGFAVTGDTYRGRAGYSLVLNGMEKGFNDKVKSRNIVMHGSFYVNEQRADEGASMGRSFGCPAVPYELHRQIIDVIRNGSCLFMYADDKFYTSTSKILNARFNWQLNPTQGVELISSSFRPSADVVIAK